MPPISMIKHVTIIGQGAIGTLWAYYLSRAGFKVTLVGRKSLASVLDLQITLPNKQQDTIALDYLAGQLPLEIDLVLVTTKAYQVNDALIPWLGQLTAVPIVLMHNGMGSIDKLPLTEAHQILIATTSHGGLKLANNQVIHTGLGTTSIGSFQGISHAAGRHIAKRLNQALPQVQYCEDITAALWTKLAINCVINPLTAVNECRNGQLSAQQYQPVIDRVCVEISQVTARLSLNLSYDYLRGLVNEVINNTAQNYSSMHQDIANQRKTEIDFITGYVIEQARRLNIQVPENERLLLEIKRLEQG